jgi:hypothetical protein
MPETSLTLGTLVSRITAYVDGQIDLSEFEMWFHLKSWGHYDSPNDPMSEVIDSVDSLLLSYEDDEIDEEELRAELRAAIHPAALSKGM